MEKLCKYIDKRSIAGFSSQFNEAGKYNYRRQLEKIYNNILIIEYVSSDRFTLFREHWYILKLKIIVSTPMLNNSVDDILMKVKAFNLKL